MKQLFKQAVSMLLALVMVLGLLPGVTLAESTDELPAEELVEELPEQEEQPEELEESELIEEAPALGEKTTVGAEDNSTKWWTDWSNVWEVPEGETHLVTFVNHSDKAENFHNFLTILQNVPEVHNVIDNPGYKEYAVMRADNYGWGDGNGTVQSWNNWQTDAEILRNFLDGATVYLYVTNHGTTADIKALLRGADGSTRFQNMVDIAVDGDLYFCLSVQGGHLTDINYKGKVEDASNPLLLNGYNVEKTAVWEVPAGTRRTISFTNIGSTLNLWNNFNLFLMNDDSTADANAYAVVRAMFDAHIGPAATGTNDWGAWVSDQTYFPMEEKWSLEAIDGANIELTVVNSGKHVGVQAAIVGGQVFYTKVFEMDTGENAPLYFYLTTDSSALQLHAAEPTLAYTVAISGTPGAELAFTDANERVVHFVLPPVDFTVGFPLPAGTYTYSASKDGYTTQTGTLTVGPGEENALTVTLEEAPQYAITVAAAQNGTVTADVATAKAGDTVTLTVAPAVGFILDTLTAKAVLAPQTVADIANVIGNGSFHDEDDLYFVSAAGDEIYVNNNDWGSYIEFGSNLPVTVVDGKYVIEDDIDRVTFTVDEEGVIISAILAYEGDPIAEVPGRSEGSFAQAVTLTEDGEKRTFTMPEGAVTVSAAFKQSVFPVTVKETQNGTVTVDKQTAEIGDTVTVTATPAAHFFLFYVGADVFRAPKTVADIANVMGIGRLGDEGYTYNLYAEGGRLYVGEWENPTEIDQNLPVTVVDGKFVVETANGDRLTFTLDEEGQITAVTLAYNGGTTVELAEGRSEGYCIEDVYLYPVDDEDFTECTFTMPEGAVTVTAVFEAIAYPITVTETQNGTVTADKETAKGGETVTLTVAPAEGFTLDTLTAQAVKAPQTVADIANVLGSGRLYYDDFYVVYASGDEIHAEDSWDAYDFESNLPVTVVDGKYVIENASGYRLTFTLDEEGAIIGAILAYKSGTTKELAGKSKGSFAQAVTLTQDAEDSTKYTFTMPQEAVTVSATFEQTVEPAYYLVGSISGWEVDETYKLTASEVEGQYVLTNVAIAAGDNIRVVLSEDGISKNTWYPDGFDNLELSQAGTYDIYFRPDGQGGNGWFGGCIYAEKQAEPVASVAVGAGEAVNYTSLQEALAAWGENATLTLLADVTISERIEVSGDKTLDLNGYGIQMTGADCVIYIADNGRLTLRDSNSERTNTGDNRPEGVVGGYITGGNADGTVSSFGGGVRMGMRATFSMEGGTITGNTSAKSGAGLYLNEESSFAMMGGTITGNQAGTNGGGVCNYKGFVFIAGGTISNNEANGNGGGVVNDTGAFNLVSGTISNNRGGSNGGGVFIQDGSLFMQGGTITGNNSDGVGGGIYATDAQVTITGGSITGNTAEDGSGVYFDSEQDLSVGGAANITGNTDDDVALASSRTGRIAIVDSLTNEAAFGVVLKNYSGEAVSGTVVKQGATALTEADLNKFTCTAEGASLRLQDGDILQSISYAITIPEMENGAVTADKQAAQAGDTVTLTVTPAAGYQLKDGKLYLAHEEVAQMAEQQGLVIKSYDEVVEMLKEGYISGLSSSDYGNMVQFVSDTNTTKMALLITDGNQTALMPSEQLAALGVGAYTEEELKNIQWLLAEAKTETNTYAFVDAASVMLEATQDAQDASKYTAAMPPFAVVIMAEFEEAAATTYPVTVAAAENGTVTADVAAAKAGDTVTLTVTPADGYALDTLTAQTGKAPQTAADIYAIFGDAKTFRNAARTDSCLLYDGEITAGMGGGASFYYLNREATLTPADDGYFAMASDGSMWFLYFTEGKLTHIRVNSQGDAEDYYGESVGTLQQAVTLTEDPQDSSKYTFTMPEGAVTVKGTFQQSTFSVAVIAPVGATLTVDGQAVTLDENGQATLALTAGEHSYSASKEGFVSLENVAFTVSATETNTLTVELEEDNTVGVGYTIDLTQQGYNNAQNLNGVSAKSADQVVSVTFNRAEGNNNPTYYDSGDAVRLYAGNAMTVSSSAPITSITLIFGSTDGTNAITASTGSFDGSTWTGNATSVTFTEGGLSGNRRIAAVNVVARVTPQPTYDVAVTAPVGATLTVDGQAVTLDDNGQATLALTAGEHSYSASKEGFVSLENVAFTVSDTWPNTLMVALELPPADLTEIEVWELGQTLDVGNAYIHQFDDNKAHCGGNVTLGYGGYGNGRHQFYLAMDGIGSYSIYIADQDGSLPLGIKWISGTGTKDDPYVFTVVHRELVLQSSDVSARTSTDIELDGREAHQYIIVEKGTEITDESWENFQTPDEYGSVLFENLTPATFYDIYARIQGGTATESITVVTLISSTEMAGEGDLVGATVSVEGDPARNYTYKWYRDTVTTEGGLEQHSLTEISGATSASYVIAAADNGYDLVAKLFLEGEEMAAMSYGTVGYGTVTFATNGGSAVESQTGKAYGAKVTKPADPTREGYALLGWYADEDFVEAWDFDTDTLCWRETTLYAKWEELPQLSDDDLAAWTQDGVQIHGVNGQEYIIVEKGAEITGESWADAKTPDGDGFVTFTQLNPATGYDIYARHVGGVGTRKITVYTSLESLGLDYDGDLVGVTITAEPDPAERAYTYQWYYDEITTVNEAQQHDLTEIQGATNAAYTTTSADEGKNFRVKVFLDGVEMDYADYGPVNYGTVTFNTNGGSAVESQTGKAYGDKVTKPADPTKDEAAFEGWFTDEDFTEAWDFDTDTLAWADTTLYAKWKSLSHGVVLGVKTTLTSPIEGVKYQWEHLRPGQTKWYKATGNYKQKTYTFTPKMNNEGYIYKCKVTLADGSVVYTEDMYIHVLAIAPTVTLSPDSTTSAIVNGTATLHAEGQDYASFRWQVQKPGSSKWSNTGSSNKDLVVKATAKVNGYKYRCAFINPTGTVYSEETELVVEMVAPKITAQPQDVTAAAKAKVTFTVEAEGAKKYVWYYQAPGTDTWKKASGGSRATLKVTAKANMNGYQYRCEVTNDAGTTITDAATLTVE